MNSITNKLSTRRLKELEKNMNAKRQEQIFNSRI